MNTHDERKWVALEEMMALLTVGDVAIPEVKEEVHEEKPVAAFPLELVASAGRGRARLRRWPREWGRAFVPYAVAVIRARAIAVRGGKWLAHFVELRVALVLPLILVRLYSLLCWIIDVQGVFVRSHLARYIEEFRALAIRRGDTDIDLSLHNSEGNLYHVLFRHGRMSSKFHGSSWEELVNDYGLRHRDMMTVRLDHYGTMIHVDFHRDGVMLFPLPCVALEDVIPSMVVRSLKEFVSIPGTGSLTLEITLDSHGDDISVSILCSYFIGLGGRMVLKKEGFGNFLLASSIEVNNLVLITFKERENELVVVFSNLP
ncbi:GATA transcription factor 13 [Hordeum vulgare]|nr:GATA transcription factor 13 [Hordeum vulgare]